MSEISVIEVLAELRARGYRSDFSITRDELLRCGSCHATHDPALAMIDASYRFEGTSDPGDEAIVFALACVHCEARGALVAAYGPAQPPEEVAVILGLQTRPRTPQRAPSADS